MDVSGDVVGFSSTLEHTSYSLHRTGGWKSTYCNGSSADLLEHLDQKSACGCTSSICQLILVSLSN